MVNEAGPSLVPMLSYADAPGAIEFLCRAFGFSERFRLPMPDGSLGHAEIAMGDALVMLATQTDGDAAAGVPRLRPPRDLPALHGQLRVYVDDVDAHYARAVSAGAVIHAPPADQDYGERIYRAEDPEGHRWIFAQRLR